VGVDYYRCSGCGECIPDCGEMYTCAKCEEHLCGRCIAHAYEDFGRVVARSEDAEDFGDDAPLGCWECSGEKEDLKQEVITLLDYYKSLVSDKEEAEVAKVITRIKEVW
jgi:hypothetical protein